jgi:hypothetical protein
METYGILKITQLMPEVKRGVAGLAFEAPQRG